MYVYLYVYFICMLTFTNKSLVGRAIRKSINEEISDAWLERIQAYTLQGDVLKLFHDQEQNPTWLSFIYNLPRGLMSFVLNASINTLPTNDNLKRWGKRLNTRCSACGNHETLHHVLNNCPIFLEQGRYTWRHDSILSFISSELRKVFSELPVEERPEIFTDLVGDNKGRTIPADILPTCQIPDMTLVWRGCKRIVVFELTVPFETNITNANERKTNKYASLINDLEVSGYDSSFIHLAAGSRGLITGDAKSKFKKLFPPCQTRKFYSNLFNSISRLAVCSSYSIFHAKNQPTWVSPGWLTP